MTQLISFIGSDSEGSADVSLLRCLQHDLPSMDPHGDGVVSPCSAALSHVSIDEFRGQEIRMPDNPEEGAEVTVPEVASPTTNNLIWKSGDECPISVKRMSSRSQVR